MTFPRRLPPDWRARVVDRVPLTMLTHAHEVGIAVALILVGFPYAMGGQPKPDSVHSQVPHFLAVGWSWSLLLGGTLTLVGLFANRPRAEWGGQLWLGYALTFYAGALIAKAGWSGFLAASIFGVLGAVSWWRSFKITNQGYVQHRLVREARDAHEKAIAERTIRENRKGRP